MPIYEYECLSCSHRFELKQGFDAVPTESCPLCQGLSRRRFYAPAVIYKGSGFYTTDYARKESPGSHRNGASEKAPEETPKPKDKETSSKDD